MVKHPLPPTSAGHGATATDVKAAAASANGNGSDENVVGAMPEAALAAPPEVPAPSTLARATTSTAPLSSSCTAPLSSPSPTKSTSPFSLTSKAMQQLQERFGGASSTSLSSESISANVRSTRSSSQPLEQVEQASPSGMAATLSNADKPQQEAQLCDTPAHSEKLQATSISAKNLAHGTSHSSFQPYQNREQLVSSTASAPPQHRVLQHPPCSLPSQTKSILCSLTRGLVSTYRTVDPAYHYEDRANPRRALTKPCEGVKNDGFDNAESDYILYVNDVLGDKEGQKYRIIDVLGQGTFGQVVKCQHMKSGDMFAVKVIKNKPAYFNQSMMEVTILDMLNARYDPHDKHHIARMFDTFIFRKHLCLVFEILSLNLYELIKQNQFKGLSTNLVRLFTSQILDALCVLNEAKIIHCDLKPENVLLKSLESPDIKVIDFGSACHEQQTVYTYIQSRFYRSPEVLLGVPYTSMIDMWSLGCVAVELFLGLPLFPGASEYNQVSRIVEMLGLPPFHMCEFGKNTRQFFNRGLNPDGKVTWSLKSIEQYSREKNVHEQPSKRYFDASTFRDLIITYPYANRNAKPAEIEKELRTREEFIDFALGLLHMNPLERWSPQQARMHPFISGQPWTGPYKPAMVFKGVSRANTSTTSGTDDTLAGRRPRATTIDSAKMTNIPPQLQRIAAVNNASVVAESRMPVNKVVSEAQETAPPPSMFQEHGQVPHATPHELRLPPQRQHPPPPIAMQSTAPVHHQSQPNLVGAASPTLGLVSSLNQVSLGSPMLHQQSPPFTSAPDQRPLPRMSKHRASAEFDYMSARLRKARSHSVTEQKLPAAWLKVLAGRSNQELASPSDGGLSSPGGSGSGASSGGTRRRSVTHMRRSNDGGVSSGESDSLSGPAFGAYPPGFRDLRRPSYGQLFPGRLAMSMSSLTEISEVPSSTTAQPISRSADNLRQIEAGLHRSSAASATPSTISSRSLHDQLQQQRIRQQLVAGAGLPSANRRMSLPNGGGGVPYGIPAYPVQDMHQSPDMYGQPPQFGSLPTQYMHFPPGVYTNARPQNYPPQQHHVAVPPPISTRLPIARMSAPLSAPLQHAGPMVSYPMYVNTTGYGLPHNQPGMSTSSALPPLPAYNHGLPHQRPQFQHGFHANFPQSHSHHHHHQQQPHFYPEHHQVHGHVRPFGGEYGDGGSSVAHGHQGIDMQLPAQPQRGSVTSLPSERDTAKPLVDNSRADHEEALTTTK